MAKGGRIGRVADPRERRMTANELLARRINDAVEYERPRNGDSGESFVCECVREQCMEALDLTIDEYVRVRSHPRRFVVVEGHDEPTIESIVAVYPGYVVVEKHGEAGRLAETDSAA
jgi:hypothetical protein